MKKYKKNNLLSFLLIIAVLIAVISGISVIASKETEEISSLSFSVGSVNASDGEFLRSETSIYTEKMFECQGLYITKAFESDAKYEVFYYRANRSFIGSSGTISGDYKKSGFDNAKYIQLQTEKIKERIASFGGKLYLEFGGKLFDDYHASRVLPGFAPDSKVRMLLQLKDEAEIVIAINADDIEKNKRRGDLGITYDLDTLRLIDAFRGIGL